MQSLQLRASMGLLRSRYVSNAKSLISGIEVGGNELPAAPRFTANAGADWTMLSSAAARLVWSIDASYIGAYWFDEFNDFGPAGNRHGAMRAPNAWIENSRLNLESGSWSVALWAKNLANHRFYVWATDLQGAFGEYFYTPNAPRTFGVEVKYSFE